MQREQLRWTDFNFALAKTMESMGMQFMNEIENRREMYLFCFNSGFTVEDVEKWLRNLAKTDPFFKATDDPLEEIIPAELNFEQLADYGEATRERTYSLEELLELLKF